MLIAIIIGLILIGLTLVVLEIVLIPGTTVVGIAGLVFMAGAVYWMYLEFGVKAGNITLGVTLIASVTAVVVSLKSGAWQRFSLNEKMEGKSNVVNEAMVKPGDEGISLSRLRPMGTVLVNNVRIEAQSTGEFIESEQTVVAVKVLTNKIIVKLKL